LFGPVGPEATGARLEVQVAGRRGRIAILGVFVSDVAFVAKRQPAIGETLIGEEFRLGPGGKGSNQAVAAARAGAEVTFISRLGDDVFGRMALDTWAADGVVARAPLVAGMATGVAYIFIDAASRDNAIIIVPGAAGTIAPADVEAAAADIRAAGVFMTQLEQPLDAAIRGLEIARAAEVVTILNPAPAAPLPEAVYPLCDFLTPNEAEASGLTGIAVTGPADAERAADLLIRKGARTVIVTLGEKGALMRSAAGSTLVPAFRAGPVVETTGAGDAFNGGLAVALAEGMDPVAAARFAAATAGISVTRSGTAPSMPTRAEIDALLARA
jgi:ribokinase